MHLTNVLGYQNRYHPWYPAPSFREVRTFEGEVKKMERFKNLLTERAGVPGRQPNHAGKVIRPSRSFLN